MHYIYNFCIIIIIVQGTFSLNRYNSGWFMVFNATFNNISGISWRKQ